MATEKQPKSTGKTTRKAKVAPKAAVKKPAVPVVPQTNSAALELVIGALREAGRIERIDEAVVMTARALASQVDEHPENAALWREYRAAEQTLRGISTYANDTFDLLVSQLRTNSS